MSSAARRAFVALSLLVVVPFSLIPRAEASIRTGSTSSEVSLGSSAGAGPFDCPPPAPGAPPQYPPGGSCPQADVPAGTSVMFTAKVSPTDNSSGPPPPTGTVTLMDNSAAVGTYTLAVTPDQPSTATWYYTVPSGSHSVWAVYSGDDTYQSATSGVTAFRVPDQPSTASVPPATDPPVSTAEGPTVPQPSSTRSDPTTTVPPTTAPTATSSTTSTTLKPSSTSPEAAARLNVPSSQSSGGSGGALAVAAGTIGLAGAATAGVLWMRRRRPSH